MPTPRLGRTLVIANPASHSGKGAAAADFVERFLNSFESATEGYTIQRTTAMGDARIMAAAARKFQTVIALGGDGVIHEVVNGLMDIPIQDRPTLGIIPMGTGNDYARTLGLARNAPEAALGQIMQGPVRKIDLGKVNNEYFMQTLSFGIDAAVAHDTTARRNQGDNQEGTALFISSSLKLLSKAHEGWHMIATVDDEKTLDLQEIFFAINIGPTYGAGFKVCPAAVPNDGLLDVCYNVRIPTVPTILRLLGMMRAGLHTTSRVIKTMRAKKLHIEFTEDVPVQTDGEELEGRIFDVEVLPDELRVITSPSCTW
ncbi:diacylglycerol/lipid kinase family protein [Atopobium fossor]|uniref:diacylglycerol/lipid kinase family protein n=1 Tax=Atopobium fossor TaxID=39487 RepID=UPI00040AFDE6|nr:diacylglycerol kinase family protein [Atopobium fossor]